jgi:tRNA threonylcarbamoyladenosine biosynthesis protein TsaB
MSLILNIDTSGSNASIALAMNGSLIAESSNPEQRDHASWIHDSINELLKRHNFKSADLSAIAVTIGPGSYTGLRVGLATAKGFCYALNIPLITENTLRVMAFHAIEQSGKNRQAGRKLFIPMIDARRMEVFTAIYDHDLNEIVSPRAIILDASTFENFLTTQTLIFGSGALKFKDLLVGSEAQFFDIESIATDLARLSYQKFLNNSFSDIVYSDPLYLKEFYSPEKKA